MPRMTASARSSDLRGKSVVPKGHLRALSMMPSLVAAPALNDAVIITHEPAACMVVERFPQLEARVEPSETVKSARVYFHVDGASSWSYTDMTAQESLPSASPETPQGAREGYYHFAAAEASGVRSPSSCLQNLCSPAPIRTPPPTPPILALPLPPDFSCPIVPARLDKVAGRP
jgi:hypothetical protein